MFTLCQIDTVMGVMYQSGPAIDAAISVIKGRDVRDLEMDHRHPSFRALKSYMKNLKIEVRTMPNRVKMVRDLVPYAGMYEFVLDKTGAKTTVQVCCVLSPPIDYHSSYPAGILCVYQH